MHFQFSLKAAFWYGLFFLVVMYFYPEAAHAANPVGKADSYVKGIYDFMTGTWVVSVVAIGIVVVGFMTLRGVIAAGYLIAVVASAFLIYGGYPIAQWLYGLAN